MLILLKKYAFTIYFQIVSKCYSFLIFAYVFVLFSNIFILN